MLYRHFLPVTSQEKVPERGRLRFVQKMSRQVLNMKKDSSQSARIGPSVKMATSAAVMLLGIQVASASVLNDNRLVRNTN